MIDDVEEYEEYPDEDVETQDGTIPLDGENVQDAISETDFDNAAHTLRASADVVQITLDKHDFIKSLSEDIQPLAQLLEKQLSLANYDYGETIMQKHTLAQIQSKFMCQFPPACYTAAREYEQMKIQAVGEAEITKGRNKTALDLIFKSYQVSEISRQNEQQQDLAPKSPLSFISSFWRR